MAERMDDGAYTNAVTGMGTLEMDKAEHVRASAYSGAFVISFIKMSNSSKLISFKFTIF